MVIIRLIAGLINAILHIAAESLTHFILILAAALATLGFAAFVISLSGAAILEALRHRRNRP